MFNFLVKPVAQKIKVQRWNELAAKLETKQITKDVIKYRGTLYTK